MRYAPDAARRVLPTNERRVIRALEVIELTGQAPTTQLGPLPQVIPSIRIGLTRNRPDLDSRIEQRVAQMWDEGLVQEVQRLADQGLRDGKTASKALGYAQVLSALDGLCSLDQAKENTVVATRKFARRQESWFKRDSSIKWLEATTTSVAEVCALVQNPT